MRVSFTLILLILLPQFVSGQTTNTVSLTDFIREIQQWNKRDDKMTLTWWVPNEYWNIALKDNKQIPKETAIQFKNIFDKYVMIWACDLRINPDATMTYTEETEVRKTITLIDKDGNKYSPLSNDQVDIEALSIVENLKPVFAQALGQFGKGLCFFLFSVKDNKGDNLISAIEQGEFKVAHSNVEFTWRTPLTTLLPPKFCPIDNEEMKGNWLYCPIHGQKLEN